MKARIKRILILGAAVIVGAYAIALASFRSGPAGYFHSFPQFPHDRADVLDFSDGVVTLRTCCGDGSLGSFSQNAEGTWIWHCQATDRPQGAIDYVIHPGVFSMRFINTKDAADTYTLRRRVFRNWPL